MVATRTEAWRIPREVYLYRDPSSATLRLEDVARLLEGLLGIPCATRDEFFVHHARGDLEPLARRIASTRVRDVSRSSDVTEPLFGEVQFELRLLQNPAKRVPALLYDAWQYLRVMRDLIPRSESTLRSLHIAFGHRLLGTFGEDGRYHAHAVLCGVPSVVSTSGLVEAPAKPEGYYKLKARLAAALGSVPFEAAKAPFEGRFLDYDDERLTDVAKGYALQAAMYHITGRAFCEDRNCRLFDAHWQADMLAAQVDSGRLCAHHAAVADRIRATAGVSLRRLRILRQNGETN